MTDDAKIVRAVELHGPFTDAEIAELLAFVRRCDDLNPRGQFSIAITAEDATMHQMERVLHDGLPERTDRVTTIRGIPSANAE
jgi:hypothetical protein